jgi:hypothetical protein
MGMDQHMLRTGGSAVSRKILSFSKRTWFDERGRFSRPGGVLGQCWTTLSVEQCIPSLSARLHCTSFMLMKGIDLSVSCTIFVLF